MSHEDHEAGDGKYFYVNVPDFNGGGLRSYLRLGSAFKNGGKSDAVFDGEDLASLVTGFTDDTRDRGVEPGADGAAPLGADVPKDVKTRAPGHNLSIEDRIKKSHDDLHTKGGWRDHCDGNRITTTNGDKVEVIRGNYKLLVLGRQADPLKSEEARDRALKNASAWEASGGQIGADAGYDPGPPAERTAQVQLEIAYSWVDDSGHRWKKVTREGELKKDEEHAVLEEYTYAWRKKEILGDVNHRVQSVEEQTFAVDKTELKDASNTLTETMHAKSIRENKYAGESVTEEITGESITERKYASTTMFELAAATTKHEISVAAFEGLELKTGLALAELTLGGALAEVKAALVMAELKMAMTAQLEVKIAETIATAELGNKINLCPNKLEVNAKKTAMDAMSTILSTSKTRLSLTETTLATAIHTLGALINVG